MQEIYSLQQESKSVTEFYSELKVLWEELEVYMPIPQCTCRYQCSCEAMRAARKNHLNLYAIRFLTGLNANFSMVKSQILLLDPLPPMTKIFSMVLQHERQGNFGVVDESKVLVNAVDSKKPYHRGGARSNSQSSRGKDNRHCTYCDRPGHTVEGCFKKHGYPPHMQRSHGAYNASTEGGEPSTVAASEADSTVTVKVTGSSESIQKVTVDNVKAYVDSSVAAHNNLVTTELGKVSDRVKVIEDAKYGGDEDVEPVDSQHYLYWGLEISSPTVNDIV
jgi:hypothetical protein